MSISKKIIGALIIIICILVIALFLFRNKVVKENTLSESLTSTPIQDNFLKKKECDDSKEEIRKSENSQFTSSKGQIMIVFVGDVFYSPKTDSCLFVRTTILGKASDNSLLSSQTELVDKFSDKTLYQFTTLGEQSGYAQNQQFEAMENTYR